MAFVSSSRRWRGCPRLSCARLQLPLSPYWTNGCGVARRFSKKQHTQDMTSTNDLITSTCSTAVFSAASCVDWEAKLVFHWMNMGKFLFLAAKSIFFISQFSEQHTSSPPGSLPRPPSSSSEPRSGANPNRFGPVIVCGFSKVPKLFKWFVKIVKYTDWMTPGIFFCCISEFQAISCSLCPFTTAWSTSPPWNEYGNGLWYLRVIFFKHHPSVLCHLQTTLYSGGSLKRKGHANSPWTEESALHPPPVTDECHIPYGKIMVFDTKK